jgi:hypothetical protein
MGATFTDISRTYTIKNDGNISTGILSISFTPDNGTYWIKTFDACNGVSLAVSATCNIIVTFKGATGNSGDPSNDNYSATLSATGAISGSLNLVLSAAQDGAILNTISGSGIFGAVSADTTRTVTVSNQGNSNSGAIAYTLISGSVSDWTLGGTCFALDLAPAETCTITITFKGTTLSNGSYSGILRIKGGSSEEELISLSATRTGAILERTAGSTAYGTSSINQTTTFTFTNNGDSASGIITTTLSPDSVHAWSLPGVSNNCAGVSLAPANSCTIDITFTAANVLATSGAYTASLQLVGASTGNLTINLTGTKP